MAGRNKEIRTYREIQLRIAKGIVIKDFFLKSVRNVCGIDTHFFKKEDKEFGISCAVLTSYPEINVKEVKFFISETSIPYIPTLLAFRELKFLWRVYKKLKHEPDIVIVDGQGIAHPFGVGIASHFGVLIQRPTIGCAKNHLFGEYNKVPSKPDTAEPLFNRNMKIGWVYRTIFSKRPIFISPGHLISVDTCLKFIKTLCKNSRVPEPVRVAHMMLKETI